MGWFDDLIGGVGDFFGGSSTPADDGFLLPGGGPDYAGEGVSDGGLFGGIGDFFTKPENLLGILGTGTKFIQGYNEYDLAKQHAKDEKEAAKFKYLVELAKLKYGGGGGGKGGGGSARNRNADLISVLAEGASGQSQALNALAQNYLGALK